MARPWAPLFHFFRNKLHWLTRAVSEPEIPISNIAPYSAGIDSANCWTGTETTLGNPHAVEIRIPPKDVWRICVITVLKDRLFDLMIFYRRLVWPRAGVTPVPRNAGNMRGRDDWTEISFLGPWGAKRPLWSKADIARSNLDVHTLRNVRTGQHHSD